VKFLYRQLKNRLRYMRQHFQTLCWPAPVWGVLLTIAMFTAVSTCSACLDFFPLLSQLSQLFQAVQSSASDSWLQQNAFAKFLWSVDEKLIGFLSLFEYFPRVVRSTFPRLFRVYFFLKQL
jgi:hypothetical protein